MGKHIDIGYFKKKIKVRAKVAKERTVINKMYAWELGKEYYDGSRLNGYGGFKYDGTNLTLTGETATSLSKITQSGAGAALEVATGSVGLGTTGASLAALEVVTSTKEALRIKSTAGSGNVLNAKVN